MAFWNRSGEFSPEVTAVASEFADTPWGWQAEELLRHAETMNGREQMYQTLNLAEMGLAHSTAVHGRRRALSLSLLDQTLSARYNPYWRPAVGEYFQRTTSRALAQIAHADLDLGWRAWKIYNMGFVVKTANHTIGFDIHPGWIFQSPLSDDQQDMLADMLDILLISHYHADHLNQGFVDKMVARQKPVILPASAWRLPTTGRLDLSSKRYIVQSQESHQAFDGLMVHSYLGAQWRVIRNAVYVVEADGQLILHPGDNENLDIYDHITSQHEIDLFLANCWAQLLPSIERIQPHTVLTGHEQEISHPGRFLHPFHASLEALNSISTPYINSHVLSWGESAFHVGGMPF